MYLFLPYALQANASTTLTVNIFSVNNGRGLEASRNILAKSLEELGCTTYKKEWEDNPGQEEPPVDINIFFEKLNASWYPLAKYNWLIPNPESDSLKRHLEGIDLILCRTHEVERIFQTMNKETYYLSFTSQDCYQSDIEKNYNALLHLAGSTSLKGTKSVVEAWKNNVSMPSLMLIRFGRNAKQLLFQDNVNWVDHKIPLNELRYTQNYSGIHLCPSRTEGFGHYLMEAMSTGAVVITIDGPPMNEFITDKRCLVPPQRTGTCRLAVMYYINPQSLQETIQNVMSLPQDELKKIGENNRLIYEKKTQEFHQNLKRLIQKTLNERMES
jgi:glycosyltransferase involved in cell wall biosynthesis